MKQSFYIIAVSLVVAISGHNLRFLSNTLEHSISVMYARDSSVDSVTRECLLETYPGYIYDYSHLPHSSDVPCIILCVLKKFGIMDSKGTINIHKYNKQVKAIHKHDPRIVVSDVGQKCAQNINGLKLGACRKAMLFVECTKLYAVIM